MNSVSETTSISVALIQNAAQELLLVWDREWGCFALPMTRVRLGENHELPETAATRAAAEALGVPVTVGRDVTLTPQTFVSGRDFNWRRYRYRVFKAQAHPDFAGAVHIHGPHLWLPPHRILREDYRPVNASTRWLVATLTTDGLLPGRSQYTAAVVLRRQHLGKTQFLLRLEPGWGYALPTKKRRPSDSYATTAQRVLADELGLTPEAVTLTPATEAVVTERATSVSEQTITFYCHGVFTADVADTLKLSSKSPLVWVDAATILGGQVTGRQTPDDVAAPDAPVSRTTLNILQELEILPMGGAL